MITRTTPADVRETRWARGVKLARDVAAGLIAPLSMSIGRCRDGTLTVKLDSSNKAALHDQFLQLVRYQTHRGLQGRALGGFSTGGSLYGFTTHPEVAPSNVEHPRKLWQINEAEAAIVRRIFTLVDEGGRATAPSLTSSTMRAYRRPGTTGAAASTAAVGVTSACARSSRTRSTSGRWTWNTTKWTRVPGKRARRRLRRPESEHVTREMPDLAIVDRETWDRIQARMTRRTRGDERTTRQGQRTYLTSGLLRCGVCGGPLSVRSAKVKGGVRYVNFGCTAHSSRGGSICSNASTISEKKITEALIGALHEVLSGPEVQEAFARAFARRVGERTKADKPADLERQLAAAQRRVAYATRQFVEAAMLPGRCLHVGIAIWYLAGLGRREVVELRPNVLRLFGVSRYAGYRALLHLEQAGLVDVERNRGRSAIVTIVFPAANTQPSPP
jgi:hypothetical protein